MSLGPIGDAEFAALVAPLAPFGPGRRVAVAVSGGADSMALAHLLRRWGDPLAIVVDHGLRAGSAEEASLTIARLAVMGVVARSVQLALASGPDLGARARQARYAALFEACSSEGLPDLFVGHHAHDQAETVMLRARAGSGPAGLAGMAAISYRGAARILRPLLPVDPARLRATLRDACQHWVEDPTNTDPATARGALRLDRTAFASAVGRATVAGPIRAQSEAALAGELANRVALYPTGHAVVDGALSADAWGALVWTVSGRPYPPPVDGVRRLARTGAGTLHGVQVRGGVVLREEAALPGPIPALEGAVWDSRFILAGAAPGAEMGALGADAARIRRRPGWPSAVLRTLPALRKDGKLLAVPHLAYPDAATCLSVPIHYTPIRPLSGAPFGPV